MELVRDSDSETFLPGTTVALSKKRLVIFSLLFLTLACPSAVALVHSPHAPARVEKSTSDGNSAPSQAFFNEILQKDEQPFVDVGNFIAALEDSADASSGSNAKKWGLWEGDPGTEGRTPPQLKSDPPQWYNPLDWWKEEHGLIMPNPVPLPPGKYTVFGDTTQGAPKLLTVEAGGSWSLESGTIDEVTHHPCKSHRYMGAGGSGCAADKEDACTSHGSPVEYRVLIVAKQAVDNVSGGTMPFP